VAAPALAPALPRRARKKLAVRERLLAEARRLLLARGIAGCGVAEIAEAADVAPGTFFNHFPSKDALVAELTALAFEPLVALMESPSRATAAASERIAAFFTGAPSALERSRVAFGELLAPLVLRAAAPASGHDPLEPLRRAWSRLLFDAQRAGLLRADVEAALLAEFAVAAIHAALVHALREPASALPLRLVQLRAFLAGGLGLVPVSAASPTPPEEDPT
jgi:AcrR family transcriptional regulator